MLAVPGPDTVRAAGPSVRHERPGALTGLVHGANGRPRPGACITATGPSGTMTALSGPDGRYALAGLRPGRYRLRAADCAARTSSGSASPATTLWPGLPAVIVVQPGQVRTLTPITVLPASPMAGARGGRRTAGNPAAGSASTGGISGLVTGGGHPLRGICALAYRVGGGSGRSAETSATGRYRITGLLPGRYQVQFSTEFSCGNSGNWLSQWYPGITTPFPAPKAAAIRVRAGKTAGGVDARLRPGGEISGTVRARAGRPLSRICVDVDGRVPGGYLLTELRSGRRGRYVLHSLFPGRYTVQFSIGCGNKGNYAPQWWRLAASAAHATPIRIKGAKIVTKIDAALDPGAAISGTIRAVNSAGQPLAGICVEATDREGDEFADADSAKNGRYRLDGLAGGRYLIRFDPSCFGQSSSNYLSQQRRVTVRQAQRLTGFNAYLRPGAGLSGVVTNSRGRKVGGACVSITSGPGSGFAVTDIDGSYSITGLPAGSYTVQFTGGCGNTGSLAPQYYNGEANSGSADPITLAAGTITPGIDATMQPGATITGVVTDPAGHRLSNICVGVADQSQLTFGAFTAIAGSTGKGSYRAENLAPGLYQVDFGCDSSSKYASHWYRASPGASGYSPDLLSVPAGVTGGISAVLRLGGSVAGKVTNTAGKAVSSACLYLVDARTGAQVLSSVFQGNIDKGRYQITGLAAGTYKVFFYACGGNYASQWYHDRLTERAADPVRVRAGHTTAGIGAALAVGGTMSGRVVARATGKPVRNVCVQAYDSASQSFGFAQTGRTGRYLMRGLGTGRYSVSFTPCYATRPESRRLDQARRSPGDRTARRHRHQCPPRARRIGLGPGDRRIAPADRRLRRASPGRSRRQLRIRRDRPGWRIHRHRAGGRPVPGVLQRSGLLPRRLSVCRAVVRRPADAGNRAHHHGVGWRHHERHRRHACSRSAASPEP